MNRQLIRESLLACALGLLLAGVYLVLLCLMPNPYS